MNLHEMMAEDAANILNTDELGYEAKYTVKETGSEKTIVVIMEPLIIAAQIRGYSIEVNQDVLITQLPFAPAKYDEIVFNGTTWIVDDHEVHGPWTVITVNNSKRPTGTKTGFR